MSYKEPNYNPIMNIQQQAAALYDNTYHTTPRFHQTSESFQQSYINAITGILREYDKHYDVKLAFKAGRSVDMSLNGKDNWSKIEKPTWQENLFYRVRPAFKVGDRVKVIKRVDSTPGWNNCWVAPMDTCIGSTFVIETNTGGNYRFTTSTYGFPEEALELVKWELPQPPTGKVWHSNFEWTEDMLPQMPLKFRPLLEGELIEVGDQWLQHGVWHAHSRDDSYLTSSVGTAATAGFLPTRTSRPLPPETKIVPLEAADVPVGAEFINPAGVRYSYTWISDEGVRVSGFPRETPWYVLKLGRWNIDRNDGKGPVPCEKEVEV